MPKAQLISSDSKLNGKYVDIVGEIYQAPSRNDNCRTFVLSHSIINGDKSNIYVDVGVYRKGVKKHEILESDLPKSILDLTSKLGEVL
ncbi:hypothetical protein [Acinetobacter bereziniae]|uniref:hypothetical protein n=1 Tax=Acinetobacter bereziniae TaxID=106648 RepID=UPI0012502AA5|nr:hypothetical protein [Acinetobacter bereziniae]